MNAPFGSIALLGLGLMGGSFARAARDRFGSTARLIAWTPDGDEPRHAAETGLIDVAAPSAVEAVAGAHLVLLAAPVGACVGLIRDLAPLIARDAIVSDIASVKAPLHAAAREAGLAHRYVGAHPLCGSERSGFAASASGLFDGVRVFITADVEAAAEVERVAALWSELGAHPERIDAAAHDRLMAWISHLPQILASTLAVTLREAHIEPERLGPGGRDMTRLAASATSLWRDILLHNREAVLEAVGAFSDRLERGLEQARTVAGDPFGDTLREGRQWARHEQ